jgi:CheY-like chemotaxis protein
LTTASATTWHSPPTTLGSVSLSGPVPHLAESGPLPGYGGALSAASHHPVLVVDDDHAIRNSLRLMLEDEGYAVVEAGDGVEAMRVLRGAERPMVVLLDIMMPRMGGEEVVREVSRDARLQSNNAFVVITANRHALSTAFQRQLTDMSIPILDKPPDIDDVIAHVARAEQRLPTMH